jgi:NodT family efflux transporter outer membrane factor (OMF) lipoprotein
MSTPRPHRPSTLQALFCTALAAGLVGCTVGPDYKRPSTAAPADWTRWRSGDASLRSIAVSDNPLPADWWRGFGDPVLDELERRAFEASPDLQTAALRFVQARVQRGDAAAAGLPQVNVSGGVSRQRQSEYGASTRLFDALGNSQAGLDRDQIAKLLGEPYELYQGGFDASWEIDLWGKVRRSLEAADASVAEQAALLDQARLSIASDLAQAYFDLRATQCRIAITRDDIGALGERIEIMTARTQGGINDHFDLERQRTELQAAEAQLPSLIAQEAAQTNRIALLLGQTPGTLTDLLKPQTENRIAALPDLALGLPSEIALRRPDIRAAEARLHSATANIGVAEADLYPSIRLGGSFNLESYKAGNLFDWASRSYSIGPTIDLPLFDGGRRKRVVRLRELEQKEAAVAFQQTVHKAWQEIDDALNGYAAEQQQNAKLVARRDSARQALDLATARYEGGVITWLEVLDSRRSYLHARRDLAESDMRLGTRYVAVNKAIGNSPAVAGSNERAQGEASAQ